MTTNGNRMIFVNLPVRDLARSKEFFGKLGFAFEPKFTDDHAACMIVSEQASAWSWEAGGLEDQGGIDGEGR